MRVWTALATIIVAMVIQTNSAVSLAKPSYQSATMSQNSNPAYNLKIGYTAAPAQASPMCSTNWWEVPGCPKRLPSDGFTGIKETAPANTVIQDFVSSGTVLYRGQPYADMARGFVNSTTFRTLALDIRNAIESALATKRPIVLPAACLHNRMPGCPLLSPACVENWLRCSGPELSRFYLLESPPFVQWVLDRKRATR
jgi:hypothetical protein